MMHFRIYITAALLVGFLAACAQPAHRLQYAQYWQRINASEAAYIQGPKVQQMLNRDITQCVAELKEMQRIGLIKDALPEADFFGRLEDPDANTIRSLGNVERDGYLLAENRPYRDFESCMHAKGWERTKFVPYDRVDRAQKDFLSTLTKGARDKALGEENAVAKIRNDYDLND